MLNLKSGGAKKHSSHSLFTTSTANNPNNPHDVQQIKPKPSVQQHFTQPQQRSPITPIALNNNDQCNTHSSGTPVKRPSSFISSDPSIPVSKDDHPKRVIRSITTNWIGDRGGRDSGEGSTSSRGGRDIEGSNTGGTAGHQGNVAMMDPSDSANQFFHSHFEIQQMAIQNLLQRTKDQEQMNKQNMEMSTRLERIKGSMEKTKTLHQNQQHELELEKKWNVVVTIRLNSLRVVRDKIMHAILNLNAKNETFQKELKKIEDMTLKFTDVIDNLKVNNESLSNEVSAQKQLILQHGENVKRLESDALTISDVQKSQCAFVKDIVSSLSFKIEAQSLEFSESLKSIKETASLDKDLEAKHKDLTAINLDLNVSLAQAQSQILVLKHLQEGHETKLSLLDTLARETKQAHEEQLKHTVQQSEQTRAALVAAHEEQAAKWESQRKDLVEELKRVKTEIEKISSNHQVSMTQISETHRVEIESLMERLGVSVGKNEATMALVREKEVELRASFAAWGIEREELKEELARVVNDAKAARGEMEGSVKATEGVVEDVRKVIETQFKKSRDQVAGLMGGGGGEMSECLRRLEVLQGGFEMIKQQGYQTQDSRDRAMADMKANLEAAARDTKVSQEKEISEFKSNLQETQKKVLELTKLLSARETDLENLRYTSEVEVAKLSKENRELARSITAAGINNNSYKGVARSLSDIENLSNQSKLKGTTIVSNGNVNSTSKQETGAYSRQSLSARDRTLSAKSGSKQFSTANSKGGRKMSAATAKPKPMDLYEPPF